mgnify:CR=1 FL=1
MNFCPVPFTCCLFFNKEKPCAITMRARKPEAGENMPSSWDDYFLFLPKIGLLMPIPSVTAAIIDAAQIVVRSEIIEKDNFIDSPFFPADSQELVYKREKVAHFPVCGEPAYKRFFFLFT